MNKGFHIDRWALIDSLQRRLNRCSLKGIKLVDIRLIDSDTWLFVSKRNGDLYLNTYFGSSYIFDKDNTNDLKLDILEKISKNL